MASEKIEAVAAVLMARVNAPVRWQSMSKSVDIDELERLLEKAGALDAKFVKAHDIHGKPTKGLLLRNGTMGLPATFANPNEAELYAALRNAAPELIAEVRRLRGLLAKAVAYFGAPSDGELDDLRLRDEDAIDLTIRMKVGDIRELHAALNPSPPEVGQS